MAWYLLHPFNAYCHDHCRCAAYRYGKPIALLYVVGSLLGLGLYI